MTSAAEFCGVVSILVVGILVFLIVAAWRGDRENRRERLSNPRGESAAGQDISLVREWDPLAELLEDAALRRD